MKITNNTIIEWEDEQLIDLVGELETLVNWWDMPRWAYTTQEWNWFLLKKAHLVKRIETIKRSLRDNKVSFTYNNRLVH